MSFRKRNQWTRRILMWLACAVAPAQARPIATA